jgi:sec-independent protein translocase protein TatC
MAVDPTPRIADYLSFVMILPLGFGISFQLPLVMLFLERIGIFTVKTYKSNWRISVLAITFLSMILTPSDPQSMLIMAVPLTFLYFGGIKLCEWMPRRTTPFGDVID